MARNEWELIPTYTAELEEIRKSGITAELLGKILQKHSLNSIYNRMLHKRYMGIEGGVPIFDRQPYYEEENPINNKINIDHFGEIVDFKTGYFAGEPVAYSYNATKEAVKVTGGKKAVEKATKMLTDFVARCQMHGVDMETTKNATIYGYSGRLMYVENKEEKVMPIKGYETVILSDTYIEEPEYGIRYYNTYDLNGIESWVAEFYDNKYVTVFKGATITSLAQDGEPKEHMFDFCPLQAIANNAECLGDAEKVLDAIDNYNQAVSDNANELEGFAHALLLVNLNTDEETVTKAQKTGSLIVPPTGTNAPNDPVKWVTKNINDTFSEHHLERLKDDIYSTTKTPNLKDATFGTASGESLKFKLHGLETKCSAFETNMRRAGQYMWKVLCSSWKKKGINIDPLQISMEFKRNFPLELLKEAQTVQTLIAAGAPLHYAYSKLSDVDDPDYLIQLKRQEQEDAMSLYEQAEKDTDTDNEGNDNQDNDDTVNNDKQENVDNEE